MPTDKPQDALVKGVAWLLAQQTKEGGWPSETYGALRGGAATTALTIYTLAHLPADMRDKKVADALSQGREFLAPGLKKRGFVACADGSLDYPTYGTALLATAATKVDFGIDAATRDKYVDWVVSGQLHESREFTPKSPHYGGWDLMGASQVIGLTSDTTVSCSCYALEAVSLAAEKKGREKSPRAWQAALDRALGWSKRCQNIGEDGGFWFSPDPTSINHKAGYSDETQTKPKTYASATADGLRCLAASMPSLEKADADERLVAARKYLQEHADLEFVPGFEMPEDDNGWAKGLRLYYYQSLAKALRLSIWPGEKLTAWADKQRAALAKRIAGLQQKDGRWQNESPKMREDDPLIATCLAVVGLATAI